jgi:hypothetical protein
MSRILGLAGVFTAIVSWGSGGSEYEEAAPAALVTPTPTGIVSRATLIADIKAHYRRRSQAILAGPISGWRVFDNQVTSPPSGLRGDALAAAKEYTATVALGGAHGIGALVVKDGTLDGQPVTFVAGDLSETGTEVTFHDESGAVHRTVHLERRYPRSEYGFYDASGKLLARAYRGQGEQPNAAGVDWTD